MQMLQKVRAIHTRIQGTQNTSMQRSVYILLKNCFLSPFPQREKHWPSTRVLTAMRASSWTPPDPAVLWNILRRDAITTSEICRASWCCTLRRTFWNVVERGKLKSIYSPTSFAFNRCSTSKPTNKIHNCIQSHELGKEDFHQTSMKCDQFYPSAHNSRNKSLDNSFRNEIKS